MTSGRVSSSVASIAAGFGARRSGPRVGCDFVPPTGWSYLRPDVSFFDEDDEPRRRAPRPRRAAGGDVAADSQTLMMRRAVAGVVIVLVLLVLILLVRSCQSSQHENSL